MLALSLIGQGKYQEAHNESLSETVEPFRLAVQSITLFKLEKWEEAQQSLDRLIENYGDRLAIPIAGSFAQRGDLDESFRWIERAYNQKDPQLLFLKTHPINDPLRADQRFSEMVERFNLN